MITITKQFYVFYSICMYARQLIDSMTESFQQSIFQGILVCVNRIYRCEILTVEYCPHVKYLRERS